MTALMMIMAIGHGTTFLVLLVFRIELSCPFFLKIRSIHYIHCISHNFQLSQCHIMFSSRKQRIMNKSNSVHVLLYQSWTRGKGDEKMG